MPVPSVTQTPAMIGRCGLRGRYLLEVVDHEEDVGVADLGLLPLAVHWVLAGGGEHLLWGGGAVDEVTVTKATKKAGAHPLSHRCGVIRERLSLYREWHSRIEELDDVRAS